MKRFWFTDQQIAFPLQQAEQGMAVGEVIRKMGISEQTFHGPAFLFQKRKYYITCPTGKLSPGPQELHIFSGYRHLPG
jgi:hypothetical protein